MSFFFNFITKTAMTAATTASSRTTNSMRQQASYATPRKIVKDGADRMYTNRTVDPTQRVFGEPGAALYFATELSESARNAGIKGEQRVAEILGSIAEKLPNTYLFHSVKLPGWEADMDHLLVRGGNVIIIDSKNWKHDATYELHHNPEGKDTVLRDGETFPGGEIGLKTHKSAWNDYLVNFNVDAILTVANDDAFTISMDNPGYQFVNLNGLEDAITRALPNVEAGELPYQTLRSFTDLVQNPNFDPTDNNNYVYVNDYVQQPSTSRPSYHTPPTYATLNAATTLSTVLTVWSILNYVLFPFTFAISGLSVIPLIIVAHKHLSTINHNGYAGAGRVKATLVFSYILFFIWVLILFLYLIPTIFGSNR